MASTLLPVAELEQAKRILEAEPFTQDPVDAAAYKFFTTANLLLYALVNAGLEEAQREREHGKRQ